MPALRLRPDLEEALRRIHGVRAASVVTTGTGEPTEIHVLAAPGRAPKQIVRDVQSLAMARFDLDVDHRIVSVVQFDDDDLGTQPQAAPTTADAAPTADAPQEFVPEPVAHEPMPAVLEQPEPELIDLREPAPVGLSIVGGIGRHASPVATADREATARVMVLPEAVPADGAAAPAGDDAMPRPTISSIMVRSGGDEVEATVTLAAGGHVFDGRAVGPASPGARPRLVAQATLEALAELLGRPAELESAQVVGTGLREVALVVVGVMTPRVGAQTVTGSAPVRTDEADAVARAVLDALNRRLSG